MLSIDHVVIAVDNLNLASERYKGAGFNVVPGGVNGPTQNALITFEDGTYIELIALQSALIRGLLRSFNFLGLLKLMWFLKPSLNRRFMQWFAGPEGAVDWCVRSEPFEQTLPLFEQQGHVLTEVGYYKRVRPDGQAAKWKLVATRKLFQPFLIEDVSQRTIRVPPAGIHPNGAKGIARVSVNGELFENINGAIERYYPNRQNQAVLSLLVPRNNIVIELEGLIAGFDNTELAGTVIAKRP